MSGNQNPQTPSSSSTKKRGLHNSPTEVQLVIDEGNKQKSVKMTEYADKNDIADLKKLITLNTTTFNDQFTELKNLFTSITADIGSLKENLSMVNARIDALEKLEHVNNPESSMALLEINAIKQIELETQLSIHNIPSDIVLNDALQAISNWSQIQLNESNFKRAKIVKKESKESAILRLEFYDVSLKHKFMKQVRSNQKNDEKKYIPILSDQVFKMSPAHTARGLELNFRDSFTELNRNIFNTARKHRDIFSEVWLSRGNIMVKDEKGKPIKIMSIEELNMIISKHKGANSSKT